MAKYLVVGTPNEAVDSALIYALVYLDSVLGPIAA
jgi:hypothetical protein